MELLLPEVETSRMFLRPVAVEDACDLFELYGDLRVFHKYANHPPLKSIDEMLDVIKKDFLAYRQKGVPSQMVIELKDNGNVIGIMDFHSIRDGIAEIGFLLAYEYWNKGYMSEACEMMVKLGFEHIGFHRIEATYCPRNHASEKVLHRNSFIDEGCLRSYMKLNDGNYHDVMICSIIKEDYKANQQDRRTYE